MSLLKGVMLPEERRSMQPWEFEDAIFPTFAPSRCERANDSETLWNWSFNSTPELDVEVRAPSAAMQVNVSDLLCCGWC